MNCISTQINILRDYRKIENTVNESPFLRIIYD